MDKNTSNTGVPKWLKNIQENSWELELLISGGAIFSLLQIDDFFLLWAVKLIVITAFSGVQTLLIVLFSLKVLTLGFSLHLCFRAYWLALLCVNYAYPNGINDQKINFQKPFKNPISENKNLHNKIVKIDRYAGLIMFASILSVFILIGIILLLILAFAFLSIDFIDNTTIGEIISWVSIILILLYILDLLLLNSLRKIKYLSYILFPLFWLFDLVSLRWFYQSAFLLFVTNVNKKRFAIACIPFLFTAFIISYLSAYQVFHWPNLFDQREYRFQMANNHTVIHSFYRDEYSSKGREYEPTISSKIQKGNYVEVFMPYTSASDSRVEKLSLPDSLKSFEQIIEVRIDSVDIKKMSWFPTYATNGIQGVTSMLPIQQFENGEHTLFITIGKKVDKHEMKFIIPFWIDRDKTNPSK